ncbi:hypothetical protein OJAV_G00038920 [Oryzias javanicus]|uniref:Secreted protein n=1 Tax=Oryzias javanicus TaxID=123683 RepID=A0A3S2N2J7_ORYJA|nr:hypothetical protein OJAV_G00038920 [Oryzias javanicus]
MTVFSLCLLLCADLLDFAVGKSQLVTPCLNPREVLTDARAACERGGLVGDNEKSREVGMNRTAAARVLVPTFLSCAIQVPGGRRRGTALPGSKLESRNPRELRGRWPSPTTSAGSRASHVTAPHKWVRTPTRALRIRERRSAADKSLPSSTSKCRPPPPRTFPLCDGASRRWHQWRALLSSADVRGLGLKPAVVSVVR